MQLTELDGLRSGMRVLDLGCGLGHLLDFFDERGLELDYVGWDISPELIAGARARYPDRPDARFEVCDILAEPSAERFDFVIACGALSMRLPDHEAWLGDMLQAMFRLCTKGLSFSLLSGTFKRRTPFTEDPELYYADPAEILAFCLQQTPQVELDHNRLAHTFAVRMYRDNPEPMLALARAYGLGREYTPAHEPVLEHFRSFFMFEPLIDYLQSLEPSAAVFDKIGMAAFHLGDSERQIAAFAQAVALAPDQVAYLQHLGIAYLDAERAHEALPVLERARQLAPDDPEIAEYLAWAKRAVGPPSKPTE